MKMSGNFVYHFQKSSISQNDGVKTDFPRKLQWSAFIISTSILWEEEMATHCSTLAWKIPWTGEPGRLQSMVLLKVGHNWATSLSLFPFMHWRRKWQPTPVSLPGESPTTEEPGGLPSVGSHRVGHYLVAAAAVYSVILSLNYFIGMFKYFKLLSYLKWKEIQEIGNTYCLLEDGWCQGNWSRIFNF